MIEVKPAKPADLKALAARDFSFTITLVAAGPFHGPQVTHTAAPVTPYVKSYGFDAGELAEYLTGDDQALFVAHAAPAGPVGYLAVVEDWNDYALVDDFAVDADYRGAGIARALMQAAAAWAKARKLAGLRIETQSNNVAACHFYENCGFVLGGYDRYLYAALQPGTEEVALFWYLPFPAE